MNKDQIWEIVRQQPGYTRRRLSDAQLEKLVDEIYTNEDEILREHLRPPIHTLAIEYTKAYNSATRGPKKRSPERTKKFLVALARLKELVVACELYQRENPEVREEISKYLEDLAEIRDREEKQA